MTGPAWLRVTQRLGEVTGYAPPREGGAWRCPAHDDRNPSMTVSNGDGRVLVNCHSQRCSFGEIRDALGLADSDFFDNPQRRTSNRARIVATYGYTDEAGALLFEVVRFDPKDFRQRRPDGAGGWDWKVAGVRRVPYRLPRVLEAAVAGGRVFVVEGEKDVEALERAGEVATCNPGGAGKWRPEFAEYLAGAGEVVIVRDKDAAGVKHAADVAASLVGKVERVVVVEAATGKDAAEHLGAGHTAEEFRVVDAPDPEDPCVLSGERPETAHQGGAVSAERVAKLQLPEEFWDARPTLADIRRAARSRLVAPDAVLGAVLTRVAAISPHTLELPPIVGSPMGLSFFVAMVGMPESGKSAVTNLAAELLPAPPEVLDRLPLGSGEGMIEQLFELVDETDENDKVRKVKRQTRHQAIFVVDEGSVVADLGGRRGSTILATLRGIWTHSTVGNANASVETKRLLDGRAYVYGLQLGIQPELAGPLLADAAGGLPQRFLWVSASDPTAPGVAEDWCEPLRWSPPNVATMQSITITRGGWRRHVLPVAATVVAEIRAARLGVLRGEVEVAPLDAHRNLLRLKVAALLSLLDGRLEVTEDDWALGGVVVGTSRRVRARVESILEGVERRREEVGAARAARRELHVEDTRTERAMISAARSVANAADRHATRRQHAEQGGGCTRSCFTQAISGKSRALVSVADAIDLAERNGWVQADGDRWLPGESRPA